MNKRIMRLDKIKSREAINSIEQVRLSGACNMLDVSGVAAQLSFMGVEWLAEYIECNKNEYMDYLFNEY